MFKYEHILKLDKQQMFKSKSSKKKKIIIGRKYVGQIFNLFLQKSIFGTDKQSVSDAKLLFSTHIFHIFR